MHNYVKHETHKAFGNVILSMKHKNETIHSTKDVQWKCGCAQIMYATIKKAEVQLEYYIMLRIIRIQQ